MVKRVLVCGGAGFIGHHLVKRLKSDGQHVTVIDRKAAPEFEKSPADVYLPFDLRREDNNDHFAGPYDEVYQLAAEVGGLGYIMDKNNDAEILHNSMKINLNVLDACAKLEPTPKIFFASSACVYPSILSYSEGGGLQNGCIEEEAYLANSDNEYAWEKLFAERLYYAYARNYDMNIKIGRFHNCFGPLGTWKGGREKAPAAICRKVAEAEHGAKIEIWGDGKQTRSFMYVDDAVEGMLRLMAFDFSGPVNIGSSRMITIEELARQVIGISQKWLEIKYVEGPVGVRGRNSDNALILEKLGWEPCYPLEMGLYHTYQWILHQVLKERQSAVIY